MNPLPTIAGLKTVLPELIALKDTVGGSLISDEDRDLWKTILERMPEIPTTVEHGKTVGNVFNH